MKKIVYTIVAMTMLLGLLFAPVTGVSAAGPSASAACGDTYTVQKGDYLVKIAKTCGVSYEALLKANPEIKDPNKIYPGQVIRIKATATLPTPTPLPTSGEYVVVKGDTLTKIATRFGTTVQAILAVNPSIKSASIIYVGQKLKLPVGAKLGGLVSVTPSSAKVGAQVEVKVTGFPANVEVDFRLGKEGQAYSVVVDGKTDASGAATVKVTIPNTAKAGEKWVVKVLTTDLANGKEASSPLITIVQ